MSTAIRYCIRCKQDRNVDPLSFRCLTCGTLTKHLSTSESPPTTAANTATVSLPATRASRLWMEQTRSLAAGFRTDATEARARAAEATAKAEHLERAAAAYEGLLKQVALDESDHGTASSGTRAKRWARNYDACIQCGTSVKKHMGNGLCTTCKNKVVRTAT